MKTGDLYFEASVDDETSKVEIDEWVLRTIRGKHGYLIMKKSWTWGKRSRTNGDWGWLDPIPDWCRVKFSLDKGLPDRYARSKSQAVRVALADEKSNIAEGFAADNSPLIVKNLTARLKAEMTRKRKSKCLIQSK